MTNKERVLDIHFEQGHICMRGNVYWEAWLSPNGGLKGRSICVDGINVLVILKDFSEGWTDNAYKTGSDQMVKYIWLAYLCEETPSVNVQVAYNLLVDGVDILMPFGVYAEDSEVIEPMQDVSVVGDPLEEDTVYLPENEEPVILSRATVKKPRKKRTPSKGKKS